MSETKKNIICTAAKLFHEKSYEGVSVDCICKACDVKKGSFYHFFASKEELAIEILEQCRQHNKHEFLEKYFASSIPPLERFERLVAAMIQKGKESAHECESFRGCPVGNMVCEMGTQNDNIRKKADDVFSDFIACFITAIDDAKKLKQIDQKTDSSSLANIIMSGIQGTVLMAKSKNDPSYAAKQLPILIATCLK